jgi:hypothetical protein
MGDVAKWPTSDASVTSANNIIKLLRKTFKEDSYPRAFLYMAMMQIAHGMFMDLAHRDLTNAGLKKAWIKIGDLLGEDKPTEKVT